MKYAKSLSEYVERYSRKDGDCILWTGPKQDHGYGMANWGNTRKRAHRAAWEVSFGPIPLGMHVLHKCDRPLCVNPDHLFLGSQADNLADMRNKGRDNQSGLRNSALNALNPGREGQRNEG